MNTARWTPRRKLAGVATLLGLAAAAAAAIGSLALRQRETPLPPAPAGIRTAAFAVG